MKLKKHLLIPFICLAMSACSNSPAASKAETTNNNSDSQATVVSTAANADTTITNNIIENIVEGYNDAEKHTKFVNNVIEFKNCFDKEMTLLDTLGYKVDDKGNLYKWNELPDGFISLYDQNSKFRNISLDVNSDYEEWHKLYEEYLNIWENVCKQYKSLTGKDISNDIEINEASNVSDASSNPIIENIVAGYNDAEEHAKFVSKVLDFRNNFDSEMTNLDVLGYKLDEKGNLYKWNELPDGFISFYDQNSKFRNISLDVSGDDEKWHKLYDDYLAVWKNVCEQYKELTGKDISGDIPIE